MAKPAQIKILPEELASQLAAGEVVERAASVVKELVENSLDAKATGIDIEVSLPRKRIRVYDNGQGIAPGELEAAVARHGTSKVSCIDDIFRIGSYGFRGEALPSIASVSRLTLSSHRRGEDAGRKIVVEGGKAEAVTDAPAFGGTEVLVENLFYNTPARRKFTRSDATEMMHITSRVIQAALSAPGVRFNFIKEKKRVLELPPAKTLLERVGQIFGPEYAANLVPIEFDDFNLKVEGLAGKPDFNRATGLDQYFFINDRPVKDVVLRLAVARSYEDLMPRGRKPVAFIFIKTPPETIDVNVHPAKAEVRFQDPSKISGAVHTAIRRALGRSAVPHGDRLRSFSQSTEDFAVQPAVPDRQGAYGESASGFVSSELWNRPDGGAGGTPLFTQLDLGADHGRLGDGALALGQLFKTFILFEDGDQLVIMDQHTVHERVLFERVMKRFRESSIERQSLLTAETVKLDAGLAGVLSDHLETLDGLGWGIDLFGRDSFAIREVPALLTDRDYGEIVRELVSFIAEHREVEFSKMVSDLAARMACRAAVKAGDALSRGEMQSLAGELAKADIPYTCPHGRPVAMTVSREKLFRNFQRPA